MNILVLEGQAGVADAAVRELTEAGHSVSRCHDRDGASFPCEGLVDGHSCPIDSQYVSVALVMRGDLSPTLTAREDGVRCALRRNIPLVLAGQVDDSPYVDYATVIHDGDAPIVDAVEVAASTRYPKHEAAAKLAMRDTLTHVGLDPSAVDVEVHRDETGMRVLVRPHVEVDLHTRDALAVRAAGAVRTIDTYATKVDVAVL